MKDSKLYPPHTVRRLKLFDQINHRARRLFAKRNTEYGDCISEIGLVGVTGELVGTMARLKQLVLKQPEQAEWLGRRHMAIRNALMDTYVYSSIALQLLEQKNWHGR